MVISKFILRYIKERTVAAVEIVIHIFHILYFHNPKHSLVFYRWKCCYFLRHSLVTRDIAVIFY